VEQQTSLNLSVLRKLICKRDLAESDIVHMMVPIRVLMEEYKLQSQYEYLNLYCNWVVHPTLSHSIVCLRVLEDLTDLLVEHTSPPSQQGYKNGTWINDWHAGVNEALGIPKVRYNIIDLFTQFDLPCDGFKDRQIWKSFALLLISCLFDRKLEFPVLKRIERKPKVKEIYDSIHRKAKGNPKYAISKVSFQPRESVPVSDPRFDVYWRLETDAGIALVGPLCLVDSP